MSDYFSKLKALPSEYARNPNAIYAVGEEAQREIGKLVGLMQVDARARAKDAAQQMMGQWQGLAEPWMQE